MPAKTASFGSDDWGKLIAVVGAAAAFGFLPKKWSVPIALAALIIALQG
jgi:hypothetical protein